MKRNEKFGIALPKNVKEALHIDKENGYTLWADAIAIEMKSVKVASSHRVLPFSFSSCNDSLTFLGRTIPNFSLRFKYIVSLPDKRNNAFPLL